MGKIGILTYHFANNYGAVLQAYALQQYICELGHEAYILNFISNNQKDNNSLYRKNRNANAIVKNLLRLPFHSKRKRRVDRFTAFCDNYLNKTKEVHTIHELQQLINFEQFDVIISGSDQVWNPNIHDFNEAFFFPFETVSKKITYAASFGKSNEMQLSSYKKYIDDFDFISVRETSSIHVIESLTNKTICETVDPVFLLSMDSWSLLANKNHGLDEFEGRKYAIGYFINRQFRSKCIKLSKQKAYENNLELVIIDPRIGLHLVRNKVVLDAGPLEFLQLIKNASIVYTDSFHGTAFGIIFKKDFYSFQDRINSRDTRKTDLLKKLGLEDQIVYLEEPRFKDSKIDYNKVDVMSLTNSSVKYLNDILSIYNN